MENDSSALPLFNYSTMRNRCGTFATTPRIEALSGRSTI
jgi:hypothetical protein